MGGHCDRIRALLLSLARPWSAKHVDLNSAAARSNSAATATAVLSAAQLLDFALLSINWSCWRDRVPQRKTSRWDCERIEHHGWLPCLAELVGIRRTNPSRRRAGQASRLLDRV